jgi:hypothetical protein
MFRNNLHDRWWDETQVALAEQIGTLPGVDPQVVERINHISRPTGDGVQPGDWSGMWLHSSLVLLALSQATAASVDGSSAKSTAKKSQSQKKAS